jgi:hypothetical protein
MVIKIQSISDVITNSSTEVYITYYPSDKNAIINVVNAILAINGEGKFEDYFEFKWIPNTDFLYEKWEEDKLEIPFEQWVESLPEYFLFSEYQRWDDCRNFIEGYSITAKDPKNSKAADLLTSLDSIFTTDVSYG